MVTSKWYTQFQVYFARIIASSESTLVCSNAVGDCIQEESLFYVSGWLVRTLQQQDIIKECPQCEMLLVGQTQHDHNYAVPDHPFLEMKRYTTNG
ncbi:hypothetical protein AALO_G00080260 [Alosa alosa]|uniref:Uncharacterized protein n=1 Tax=Alosa alosa TaxID=278164 RepID=A0AAV6H0W5_9TELE|nr:hypothetical protein AALO_G00080260 [Alosa alosa]